jgi:lipopolysaccharide transport system ATP-binding protein
MSDHAIKVESLGKCYHIPKQREGHYLTLRDRLTTVFKRGSVDQLREDFWALKDVSFDLPKGEVLGVIGRNGSGKSTLLKMISRITEPTKGRITVHGRVSCLLEVGTGFHPELTGRENIYLNGAILGMRKNEVAASFDEIVAFAEVEQFLDTPVKRYSSGMYVRLAFAVAAHLEPEILIVDEVLAVGDAAFQKKCLGKMRDVAQQKGRTVLFVSHNLSSVRQLTTRCLVLEKGQLVYQGSPENAISRYVQNLELSGDNIENQSREYECTGDARFVDLRFKTSAAVFPSGVPIEFIAVISIFKAVNSAFISLTVLTQESNPVGSGFSAASIHSTSSGRRTLSVCIPPITLAPGRYYCIVALSFYSGGVLVNIDAVSKVLHFEILADDSTNSILLQWNSSWGPLKMPLLETSYLQ